jgi:hypothetical protein
LCSFYSLGLHCRTGVPRDRRWLILNKPPLESDDAWVGLGNPGGLSGVSFYVQAYNEFYMGAEWTVAGYRKVGCIKCAVPRSLKTTSAVAHPANKGPIALPSWSFAQIWVEAGRPQGTSCPATTTP